MSKRLLFRHKIVRLYEEDIWGIFYKKQQRRNLFLKKLKYLFFLYKLYDKIRNFFFYKKRFFAITKKYLNINMGLKKKKIRKFKRKHFYHDRRGYLRSKIIKVSLSYLRSIKKKKKK